MRVTDQMTLEQSLDYVRQAQGRLLQTQRQAASGVKVELPSDDPVAYARINGLQQQLSQLTGYGQNADRVKARLDTTDATLQDFQGALVRLRELTMVALNAANGTSSSVTEAQQLYSQMLSQANQSFDGQYLFSPYSKTPPFSGATFVGDNQKQAVEVSPLGATQFGISAQDAFGVAPGQDAFTGIANLISAMQAGNRTGVQAGLDAIDASIKQLAQAQVQLGAQYNTLQLAQHANQTYTLTLTSSQSALHDIDPAQAYSQLAADQYAVQATYSVLGSGSRLGQSLLQYL